MENMPEDFCLEDRDEDNVINQVKDVMSGRKGSIMNHVMNMLRWSCLYNLRVKISNKCSIPCFN